MPKRRRSSAEGAPDVCLSSFLSWANSFKKVSKWLGQYDLEQLLDDNGGIVQLTDFLPSKVAEGALCVLQQISEDTWTATDADEDVQQNNITHSFASTKDAAASEGLEELFRVMQMLLPEELNTFSAARYSHGHHIDAHDDRAYTDVLMENGQVVQCSRTIAVIYYLTKDWTEDMGGLLRDCVTDQVFVPQFNSLIAFRVPRYHQVTPVSTVRPRLSVFGWFLQEGQCYDLYRGVRMLDRHRHNNEPKADGTSAMCSVRSASSFHIADICRAIPGNTYPVAPKLAQALVQQTQVLTQATQHNMLHSDQSAAGHAS